MDEFGVLVGSIGFKSQKLTPMALLKSKPASNFSFSNGLNQSSSTPSNSTVWNEYFVEGIDGIFKPQNNISNSQKSQQFHDDGFDIFGSNISSSKPQQPGSQGNIDLDSAFGFVSNSWSSSGSKFYNETSPTGSAPADDLLGDFSFAAENSKMPMGNNVPNTDDLIPGFGESSTSSNASGNNGIQPGAGSSQSSSSEAFISTFAAADDPFLLFEVSKSSENDLSKTYRDPLGKKNGRASLESSIDELEKFATFKVSGDTTKKPSVTQVNKIPGPKKQMTSPQASVTAGLADDLLHFEDAPTSDAFKEIKGESEERRRVRLSNEEKIKKRMDDALLEKIERDAQVRKEQEMRRMLAENVDYHIKDWSTGKEGNLLALLSSLQDVLWPECGWKPVSLTDLIAPAAVKRVYQKAIVCVHPDKVQQKGFDSEEKYIAEKVFYLLKEAYNKHNTQGPQSSFNVHF